MRTSKESEFYAVKNLYQFLKSREKLVPMPHIFHTNTLQSAKNTQKKCLSGEVSFTGHKVCFIKKKFAHNRSIDHEEQTFQCSNRIIHYVEYLANICKHYRPILDGIDCKVQSGSILFEVASKGFIMFMGRLMQILIQR